MILGPGPAIALAALLFAVAQFFYNQHKLRLETTLELFRYLNSQEALAARFKFRSIVDKAEALPDSYAGLSDDERVILGMVAAQFGYAGSLLRTKVVKKRLLLSSRGHAAVMAWDVLAGYNAYQSNKHGRAPSGTWEDFKFFVELAKKA